MKLRTISIRNFRSYTVMKGEPPQKLELGDGPNILIGPNNCGKSNLLRAVALALQESGGVNFDPETDIPSQLSLTFLAIRIVRLRGRCFLRWGTTRDLLERKELMPRMAISFSVLCIDIQQGTSRSA